VSDITAKLSWNFSHKDKVKKKLKEQKQEKKNSCILSKAKMHIPDWYNTSKEKKENDRGVAQSCKKWTILQLFLTVLCL
jgi:hypothetical protein